MYMGKRLSSFMFVVALLVACVALFHTIVNRSVFQKSSSSISQQGASKSDEILADAFKNHASDIEVLGQGTVVRILPDDNSGKRHQRFIIRLATGQTLMIAHNIDIAQRISGLQEGDEIRFSGMYEWNDQGGVIHYTHRDPGGRHVGGWLECKGQKYE
jgi:hypothetical protein